MQGDIREKIRFRDSNKKQRIGGCKHNNHVHIYVHIYNYGHTQFTASDTSPAQLLRSGILQSTHMEKYLYYQTIINSIMEHCFSIKTVTRHTADKPWITDLFRNLMRKRQRAFMSGNRDEYRVLRNMVNRASSKLKFEFYQKHILAISESGSRDWLEKNEENKK